jgi:hypothetical protein
MKIVISEQQLRRIITEQSSGGLIPSLGYKIINDIEHTYSFTTSDGKVSGGNYNGKEKESNISEYIDNTIGLDSWNKLNDLFKVQLYSYMYQHDSGDGGMRMWWIAGLAQAIDSNIKRPLISKKPLTDPNVVNAIKIIKDACKNNTINSYYKQWLTVVDNQMSGTGSQHPDNYKNVWKNRPRAIERLMSGEKWDVVKKEFNSTVISEPKKSVDVKTTPVDKPNNTPVINSKTISIKSVDLSTFLTDIKTETLNKTLDLNSVIIDVDNLSLTVKSSDKGVLVKKLVLTLSTQADGNIAADNVLGKNPGSKVISKGKFENDKRTYYLIALI